MVEAGESEYSGLLKTRRLLKNRHAQKFEKRRNCAQLERNLERAFF